MRDWSLSHLPLESLVWTGLLPKGDQVLEDVHLEDGLPGPPRGRLQQPVGVGECSQYVCCRRGRTRRRVQEEPPAPQPPSGFEDGRGLRQGAAAAAEGFLRCSPSAREPGCEQLPVPPRLQLWNLLALLRSGLTLRSNCSATRARSPGSSPLKDLATSGARTGAWYMWQIWTE
ncbi:hypothetical protein ABFV05_020308 [Capra hircus]